MRSIFLFVCLFTVVIACKKDKLDTKPTLTVKSTSSKIIEPNGKLNIVFEFTDKEGDIKDSLFFNKVRLNVRTTPVKVDTIYYKIPIFPKNSEGEFNVNIPATDLEAAINPLSIPGTTPPKKESDTLNLKFAIKDKANHSSDTVIITGIVVQRN